MSRHRREGVNAGALVTRAMRIPGCLGKLTALKSSVLYYVLCHIPLCSSVLCLNPLCFKPLAQVVDDNLGFSKDRTISRLTEMQSLEWVWGRGWLACGLPARRTVWCSVTMGRRAARPGPYVLCDAMPALLGSGIYSPRAFAPQLPIFNCLKPLRLLGPLQVPHRARQAERAGAAAGPPGGPQVGEGYCCSSCSWCLLAA